MKDSCRFCSVVGNEAEVTRFGSVVYFLDAYPVSKGHTLIVPERHVTDVFEMGPEEVKDMWGATRIIAAELLQGDHTISGFNIGTNVGEDAGQTVMHAHVHVIPRRKGDTPNPRGGVRGVIPDRMEY